MPGPVLGALHVVAPNAPITSTAEMYIMIPASYNQKSNHREFWLPAILLQQEIAELGSNSCRMTTRLQQRCQFTKCISTLAKRKITLKPL